MTQPAPASRHTVDNLINRAERGQLTGDEAAKLREGIGQLYDWLTTARAVARAEQKRAERAEAALNAVRAELDALNSQTAGLNPYAMAGRRDAVARVRTALDAHTRPGGQPT